MRRLFAAALLVCGVAGMAQAQAAGTKLATITMTFGDAKVIADLMDTPPSRDLLARLPTTVSMSRLGDREYAGRPQPQLSTDGKKQEGFANGDVGYWAPGGYLAVFFDDSKDPNISDLIVMGNVTSDLGVFDSMGQSVDVRIERVETIE